MCFIQRTYVMIVLMFIKLYARFNKGGWAIFAINIKTLTSETWYDTCIYVHYQIVMV